MKTPRYSTWMVLMCPKQIQDGGWPPSWKIKKIFISSQPIDRFWRNLERLYFSALQNLLAYKRMWFLKFKMEAVAILKHQKIAKSPLWVDQIQQKLARSWPRSEGTRSTNPNTDIWSRIHGSSSWERAWSRPPSRRARTATDKPWTLCVVDASLSASWFGLRRAGAPPWFAGVVYAYSTTNTPSPAAR